jgi:cell division septal protein FtsQ
MLTTEAQRHREEKKREREEEKKPIKNPANQALGFLRLFLCFLFFSLFLSVLVFSVPLCLCG